MELAMVAAVVIVIVLAVLGVGAYVFRLIRVEKVGAAESGDAEGDGAESQDSEMGEGYGDDVTLEDPFGETPPDDSAPQDGASEDDEMLKLYEQYYGDGQGEPDENADFEYPQGMESGMDVPEEDTAGREKAIYAEIPAFDRLSELMTGRAYMRACGDILEQARQSGTPYAVAYFDIDRFRFINSIKGYSLGDYVLSRLAQELAQIFPEGSLYTRLSADHFAAVFPLGSNASYEEYNELIRKACEKIRGDVGIKSVIRVCMGVAFTDSSPLGHNMGVLLHKANVARHCLKISKSDTFMAYDETMMSSYLSGESALDDYSENQYGDEFAIYYQSITDLSRGKMAGCEALARWANQEDSGLEPLNSDTGRLPTNNTKVFYHVCRAASRWRKSGKDVAPLFIYITEMEFFKGDFDEFAAKCLSEFQLEPGLINIMLDASVVRMDWTVSSHQIKRLRDMGLKVGVVGIDLNTQSLDFLGGLTLNFIKLQAGFARDISKYEEKADAVRRMLSMAQAQNLRVIVEGVDMIDQMQTLQKLGVNLIEGRYNGLPSSADDFIRMLDDYTGTSSRAASDTTVILDDMSLNRGEYNV
ncbi:MAG: bifunctional diguanylate cyclase/phosphodiesterase [Oscillospiraceae bacterium]|jgi:diguanylate cyclase (GGDEF)-like protein|nr:bifunctional diguanylate cyclase/phosphodiesterase [Oscillospiraceae bacterium]